MSQRLISRSPDLRRLQAEGFHIDIRSGWLLLSEVPHLDSGGQIKRGTLAVTLSLAGDTTIPPTDHTAKFIGDTPCGVDGQPLSSLIISTGPQPVVDELVASHTFSRKPITGHYADHYEQLTTYATHVSRPALQVDAAVTAITHPVVTDDDPESPFTYVDTATSRAEIDAANDRLRLRSLAIVGLGGTGSYILDLVAKTPVWEIRLIDGDTFDQHNAFRSPGAPSVDDLRDRHMKVGYFADIYSKMHRNIVSLPEFLNESNIQFLHGTDFVFVAIDRGAVKRLLIAALEDWGVPFIDVGMGVHEIDGALSGLLRVTTSTPEQRNHIRERHRISFADRPDDDYSRNVQVADLNALNAVLAVMKWKKLFGFYADLEREFHSVFQIDGNSIANADQLSA